MAARWTGLFGLGLALLGLTGCWTTQPSLRPPPRPEEYVLPPSDDARFSSAPTYPKGTLNNDLGPKNQNVAGPGGPGGALPRNSTRPGGPATGGAYGGRY